MIEGMPIIIIGLEIAPRVALFQLGSKIMLGVIDKKNASSLQSSIYIYDAVSAVALVIANIRNT